MLPWEQRRVSFALWRQSIRPWRRSWLRWNRVWVAVLKEPRNYRRMYRWGQNPLTTKYPILAEWIFQCFCSCSIRLIAASYCDFSNSVDQRPGFSWPGDWQPAAEHRTSKSARWPSCTGRGTGLSEERIPATQTAASSAGDNYLPTRLQTEGLVFDNFTHQGCKTLPIQTIKFYWCTDMKKWCFTCTLRIIFNIVWIIQCRNNAKCQYNNNNNNKRNVSVFTC